MCCKFYSLIVSYKEDFNYRYYYLQIPSPKSTIIDTDSCIRCPDGTCTDERCGYTNGPNGETNVRIYFMNVKRTATVEMHEHTVGVRLRSYDPQHRKDYEKNIKVLPAIVGELVILTIK